MQFKVYVSVSSIEYNTQLMLHMDIQNIVSTYVESGLGFVSLEFGPSVDKYSPRLLSFNVKLCNKLNISATAEAGGRIRLTPLSDNVKLNDGASSQAELDAMCVRQWTPAQSLINIE